MASAGVGASRMRRTMRTAANTSIDDAVAAAAAPDRRRCIRLLPLSLAAAGATDRWLAITAVAVAITNRGEAEKEQRVRRTSTNVSAEAPNAGWLTVTMHSTKMNQDFFLFLFSGCGEDG